MRFVIKRDPQQRFRFSRLQSAVARQLLAEHDVTNNGLESVVLICKGQVYRKSRAALRILLLLNRSSICNHVQLYMPNLGSYI